MMSPSLSPSATNHSETAGQNQEFLGSAGDQVAVRRASLKSSHIHRIALYDIFNQI